MKKQYKSSVSKNDKIKENVVFDGVPLKGYKKKKCGNIE